MHRTEGENNSAGMFANGPPGTRVEENWLNSLQEEICYTIEQAGVVLKTASTDTRTQLLEALQILFVDSLSDLGIVSTSAEINQLHSSDITTADLVKLHAVSKTAVQIDSHMPTGESYFYYNASGLTLDDDGTLVASRDLGTVSVGDVFIATGHIRATKGGTGGVCRALLYQSAGTAAYEMSTNEQFRDDKHIEASVPYSMSIFAIFKITTAGTFTLSLNGYSSGSDSAVIAEYCGLHAQFLIRQ